MKTPQFTSEALRRFFQEKKIGTLEELRVALGHPARATVFRKLGELEYLSSYTHRGKYYTLRSIARFGPHGLWSFHEVWFSRLGNLLATAQALVEGSRSGFTAAELRAVLHVKTKHALAQQERRRAQAAVSSSALIMDNPDLAVEEAKAIILLFYGLLNERQRRLYAGLESLKLGHGGDAHIAAVLGIDPRTVARGRRELLGSEIDLDRVRAIGGGRPSQGKNVPL